MTKRQLSYEVKLLNAKLLERDINRVDYVKQLQTLLLPLSWQDRIPYENMALLSVN